MRFNSLAARLFATAAVWTLIVLPFAGMIIYSLYRTEASQSFDDRIRTLLLVVLTDSIGDGGLEPGRPSNVGEPLFEVPGSGWYWQVQPLVKGNGSVRLASASLKSAVIASPYERKLAADAGGVRWMNGVGPDGQPLRIAETLFSSNDGGAAPVYSYIVAGPADWLEARIASFRDALALALTLAGLGLVFATYLQVRFALRPLRAIERGLAAIRSGEARRLEGALPVEIEPLQDELNALIRSNDDIIERARTQVGNLAHALKTPLAVITNEAREDRGPLGAKVTEQAGLMRDQIAHYLDRARMAAGVGAIGRVSEVAPVLDGLQRALERIHRDRGIAIAVSCPAEARFLGERHDLEEMLGNLMDNACKWAASTVRVTATAPGGDGSGRRRLTIVIEDDGVGLPEEQRQKLGKRGVRLDETKPGSGLGLSIVTDLATTYRGTLTLDRSAAGGLLARLDLPAA